MLEYLFFNNAVAEKFRAFLGQQGLSFEEQVESIQQALLIVLAEPEDDELWDKIDDYYDELSAQDQEMVESQDGTIDSSRAGIYLQLTNGEQTIAKVDPAILNRILTAISMEELNLFLDTIVKSVEQPDDSPICKVDPQD